MFYKEDFIEDCRAAIREKDAQSVIRELVARAVSEPSQLMRIIGEPKRAGIETIHTADDLTILNICWGPRMQFKPHDHHMWAVIGIYTVAISLRRHAANGIRRRWTSGPSAWNTRSGPLQRRTRALGSRVVRRSRAPAAVQPVLPVIGFRSRSSLAQRRD
jgi:hypothetical protein